MWPGFDSRTRRNMWVEFVVGSRPGSGRPGSGRVMCKCDYSGWVTGPVLADFQKCRLLHAGFVSLKLGKLVKLLMKDPDRVL